MFTVIFLSRSARGVFAKSRAFFDPFIESGEIAFCDWNESPNALTTQQALPQLAELIRGRSAWRAVVVDHFDTRHDGPSNKENPFDFEDSTDLHLSLIDSPHPLVRIAHQLLGYPTMTARDFEPVISYRGEQGERVEIEQGHGQMREALHSLGRTHSDVRVEYREVAYSPADQVTHEHLRERYRMKEVHPSEVVFISTRPRIDPDERSQLVGVWRNDSERQASRFVERNDYPPASRFAVYDLLNRENSGYDQDELRLWISVLTVAVNELPPSAFQAERIYRLAVDVSEESLGALLNEHMSRLTALREHLDTLTSRAQHRPETDVRELLNEEKVHVEFESITGSDLVVGTAGYGLATDIPVSEVMAWSSDFDELELNAAQFLRRPRRVLARAVFDTRVKVRGYLGNEYVLSAIDRDEIEDELTKRAAQLTAPATDDILDRARLDALLHQQNQRVRRHISERMNIGTVAIASAVVAAVWLGIFVPYVLQASTTTADSFQWSIFIVAAVILTLTLVAFASLLWMRRRLIALLHGVNATMAEFVRGVNKGAAVFGEYLSELATYMHARAVLIGSQKQGQRERALMNRVDEIRGRAMETIRAERLVVTSLGQPLTVRRLTTGFRDFDIDDRSRVASFFRFPIGATRATFNESGETIAAPYDFVQRLSLERVPLFEPDSRAARTAVVGLPLSTENPLEGGSLR